MTWTLLATVVSDSEPGKHYKIKRREDGTLGCACPSYRFMQGSPKTCKHLRAFSASEDTDCVQVVALQTLDRDDVFRRSVRERVRPTSFTGGRRGGKRTALATEETFVVTRSIAIGGF